MWESGVILLIPAWAVAERHRIRHSSDAKQTLVPPVPFFLVPTNVTLQLATTTAPLGHELGISNGSVRCAGPQCAHKVISHYVALYRKAQGPLPLEHFQQTYWRPLQHVIIRELAAHPERTLQPQLATFCVAATARAYRTPNGWSSDGPICRSFVAALKVCPTGLPLVVVDDAIEPDFAGYKLCFLLWNATACSSPHVLRVVAGPPGILLRRNQHLAGCRGVLTVPWLSHARVSTASLPRLRPMRIAAAFGAGGHPQMAALGFGAWRTELGAACARLKRRRLCEYISEQVTRQQCTSHCRAVQPCCLLPPASRRYVGALWHRRRGQRRLYSCVLPPRAKPTVAGAVECEPCRLAVQLH